MIAPKTSRCCCRLPESVCASVLQRPQLAVHSLYSKGPECTTVCTSKQVPAVLAVVDVGPERSKLGRVRCSPCAKDCQQGVPAPLAKDVHFKASCSRSARLVIVLYPCEWRTTRATSETAESHCGWKLASTSSSSAEMHQGTWNTSLAATLSST